MLLVGCAGQFQIPRGSPERNLMQEFDPGSTTRAQVNARLGEPFYTASPWRAEIFRAGDVFQEFLFLGLPIPAGTRVDDAPLLAVYDAAGVLTGIGYFGAQRSGHDVRGDLGGLRLRGPNMLLGPKVTARQAASWQPAPGQCQIVVPVDRLRARASLYLDARFVSLVDGPALLRIEIDPGVHRLACREDRLIKGPARAKLPGQPMPASDSWLEHASEIEFECPADGTRHLRVTPGSGFYRYCDIQLAAGAADLPDAPQLIIPDLPTAP